MWNDSRGKTMAKLSKSDRAEMPSSEFAGPGKTYPVPDKNHARLAKSGASHAEHVGNISESEKAAIDRKADRKLGIKEGSAQDRRIDRSKGITEHDRPKHRRAVAAKKIVAPGSYAERHRQ